MRLLPDWTGDPGSSRNQDESRVFECGRLVGQWTEKGIWEEGAVSVHMNSVPHMKNVQDIQVEMSDRSQEI